MASSSAALGPGAAFGPYTIRRQVGRGAFGIVYEAVRNPLKRRVALKVLHEHVLSTPDAVTRFQREIMAAAQVEHPHVVQVFDGGMFEDRGFLAMEFLEGETLAERLERDKYLHVEEAMDIFLPIASALDAVHSVGIVHRDIKPGNIFLAAHVTGIASPRLVDFGIAKLVSDAFDLTQTHAWLGTPFYMSPEQVRQSKHIDARSDQWSLGVVLYEVLTGEKPFRQEVLLDLLEAITGRDPSPPSSIRASIPKGLETVLGRMMERDSAHRYGSMRAVGAALWPFASPRTRALWARYYGHENDPAAKLDDVIEARDSGFVGPTDVLGERSERERDEPTNTRPLVRTEPSPFPLRSLAWGQVAMGAAVGALALYFGQHATDVLPVPLEKVSARHSPGATGQLPVLEATLASILDATPAIVSDGSAVAPRVVPPIAPTLPDSISSPDGAVLPTAVATRPSLSVGSSSVPSASAASTVRGAPYCDGDPSWREGCAALLRNDRATALRAFQNLHGPRALVALAHLYRQAGRLVDAEERLVQALREGGDPWMVAHTSFTNSLLNDVQARLGTLVVGCAHGEMTVGAGNAARRYALPHNTPVRAPTGHVQVVITYNGISFQQYVDVRAGQTVRVTSCGAGG